MPLPTLPQLRESHEKLMRQLYQIEGMIGLLQQQEIEAAAKAAIDAKPEVKEKPDG